MYLEGQVDEEWIVVTVGVQLSLVADSLQNIQGSLPVQKCTVTLDLNNQVLRRRFEMPHDKPRFSGTFYNPTKLYRCLLNRYIYLVMEVMLQSSP